MEEPKSTILRFRVSTAFYETLEGRAKQLNVKPPELARIALAMALAGDSSVASNLFNSQEGKNHDSTIK